MFNQFPAVLSKAQDNRSDDSLSRSTANWMMPQKKNYLFPLAKVTGINLGVHLFDRFVLITGWAQVDWGSIRNNLNKGPVWDNDSFSTNLFWHPYHGSLYFNSARSSGLNFWQSTPYAFGGSLMWEYFGEREQPSLNDLFATTIGGMALGEIMHRASHLVLDNSATGWERVGRELAAGIMSPMNLLDRLASGKAWKLRFDKEQQNRPPFKLNLSVANRFMSDLYNNRNHFNTLLSAQMIYGNHFTEDIHRPYDCFTVNFDLNVLGNQPIVSNVNIIGLIWAQEWNKDKHDFLAGIFQHFDYYDSNPLKKDAQQPFKFAETASFGGGFIYGKKQKNANKHRFIGSLYANAVFLGASDSDYYQVENRNYNIGSGYSVKLSGIYNFSPRWNTILSIKNYYFFTHNPHSREEEALLVNLKGNSSNSMLSVIATGINFAATKYLTINMEQRFYSRQTQYKYFDNISTTSTENRIKLIFQINR
ncbi:MAG: DUF3943 domain-containing protein [Prevotellaceae bacterium]|jgi:hypothetical protein|nr:DUF3943 domain-containing protein [Prevotellaceae bacterium]